MKNVNKWKVLILTVALGLGGVQMTQAQGLKVPTASTLQKVSQGFALSEIQVEYSRPSAKGREIFGALVPYGKVWRTGANQSSKITFGEDVKINGKELKAGTYAIYSVPQANEWKLSFYKDLKLGGNVAAYDATQEALTLQLPVKKLADKVETFTIAINDISNTSATVSISWENTEVSFEVTAEIDNNVMESIEKAMKDNRPYHQAAAYYLENGKDLNKAYEWSSKAAEQNPHAFWVFLNKAKIEFQLGKYAEAIQTAEQVKVKAAAMNNDDYIKMADELIGKSNEELKKIVPAAAPAKSKKKK